MDIFWRRCALFVIILIVMLCTAIIVPARNACANVKPRQTIPPIAHIAGYIIGVDSIEQMEKRLGKAETFMGGHPNGGRSWWLKKARRHIVADGFDYSAKGRVITDLDVSQEDAEPNQGPGRNSISSRSLRFMGVIEPGMSRGIVLHQLRHRLPLPEAHGQDLARIIHECVHLSDSVRIRCVAAGCFGYFRRGLSGLNSRSDLFVRSAVCFVM